MTLVCRFACLFEFHPKARKNTGIARVESDRKCFTLLLMDLTHAIDCAEGVFLHVTSGLWRGRMRDVLGTLSSNWLTG